VTKVVTRAQATANNTEVELAAAIARVHVYDSLLAAGASTQGKVHKEIAEQTCVRRGEHLVAGRRSRKSFAKLASAPTVRACHEEFLVCHLRNVSSINLSPSSRMPRVSSNAQN